MCKLKTLRFSARTAERTFENRVFSVWTLRIGEGWADHGMALYPLKAW